MNQSRKHAGSAGGSLRAGFDRTLLPGPLEHYTGRAALSLREQQGLWRTTRCEVHSGHDSNRTVKAWPAIGWRECYDINLTELFGVARENT